MAHPSLAGSAARPQVPPLPGPQTLEPHAERLVQPRIVDQPRRRLVGDRPRLRPAARPGSKKLKARSRSCTTTTDSRSRPRVRQRLEEDPGDAGYRDSPQVRRPAAPADRPPAPSASRTLARSPPDRVDQRRRSRPPSSKAAIVFSRASAGEAARPARRRSPEARATLKIPVRLEMLRQETDRCAPALPPDSSARLRLPSRTWPSVGVSMPASTFSSVDLPAPLGPIMATDSVASNDRERSLEQRRRCRADYRRFSAESTLMSAAAAPAGG